MNKLIFNKILLLIILIFSGCSSEIELPHDLQEISSCHLEKYSNLDELSVAILGNWELVCLSNCGHIPIEKNELEFTELYSFDPNALRITRDQALVYIGAWSLEYDQSKNPILVTNPSVDRCSYRYVIICDDKLWLRQKSCSFSCDYNFVAYE